MILSPKNTLPPHNLSGAVLQDGVWMVPFYVHRQSAGDLQRSKEDVSIPKFCGGGEEAISTHNDVPTVTVWRGLYKYGCGSHI